MNAKYRVFAMLGVVFLLSLGFYFYSTRGTSDVVLIGTVDANQVIVSSKVAGRIERLLVDEGQSVKQGELIAQIDNAGSDRRARLGPRHLDGLRSQVRQSSESYASTHGETDAQVNNAAAALKAAQASLEESEANERQQALDTRRTVALAEEGVASQQDRDRAEQTLAADQARVRANREQVIAARATLNTMQARINQAAAAHSNIAATEGADGLGQRQAGRSRSTHRLHPHRRAGGRNRQRARGARRRGGQRRARRSSRSSISPRPGFTPLFRRRRRRP